MRIEEFRTICKTWLLYHNLAPIKNVETINEWFKDVQNVPSEAVEWITRRGKDGDPPRSIPNLVWQLFRQWREVHPEKAAAKRHEGPPCSSPWCEDGLMHVGKPNEAGQWQVWAYRCGVCRKAQEMLPFATPGQLQEEGFEQDTHVGAYERFRDKFGDAPRRRYDNSIDWRKLAQQTVKGDET